MIGAIPNSLECFVLPQMWLLASGHGQAVSLDRPPRRRTALDASAQTGASRWVRRPGRERLAAAVLADWEALPRQPLQNRSSIPPDVRANQVNILLRLSFHRVQTLRSRRCVRPVPHPDILDPKWGFDPQIQDSYCYREER